MLLSKVTYNEDNGSNQIQQKSNDMQALWQVSISLTVHVARFFLIFLYIINKRKTDRIEKEKSKLVLEAFFAFVNCIIN